MYQSQKDYLTAKEIFDTASEKVNAETDRYSHLILEDRISEFVAIQMDAEDRHEVMEKLNALWDAKAELLKWGREMALKFSRSERERAAITELFDKLPGHPEFKDRAVDICMRLGV